MMPYAPYDFSKAPWPDISLPTRLALFHQALEGLRNLHAAGIMHRDISPRNTLILSLSPDPKAAICGFGKSKRGTTGKNTSLGPPDFVAPEVLRQEGYTNAIEVFSLGLTMLYTFPHSRRVTGPMDREDRGSYRTVLGRHAGLREKGQIPDALADFLRAMLSWDPVHRPTAAQALDHEAWHGVVAAGVEAGAPSPTTGQGRGVSFDGGTVTGSGGGSGGGTGGREKRMRRSGDRSSDTALGASGSGAGRAKRVRRPDGPSPDVPSPDTPPGSSGGEE